MSVEVPINDITLLQEIYPRDQIDTEQVNLYRTNIDELPPIILNKENILIDGAHRLQAHEIEKRETIKVIYHDIPKDRILIEAIKSNAKHGKQLTRSEKKRWVRNLYEENNGNLELDFREVFAVAQRTIEFWTQDIRSKIQEDQAEQIFQLDLQFKDQVEIANQLGVSQSTVSRSLGNIQKRKLAELNKPDSLHLIDNWSFSTPDPQYGTPGYPGRASGQAIENFLYYCTEPFAKVVDPMAGGGTTGDVCKAMYRRYLMYDLHPYKSRPDILQHDITQGYPKKAEGCDAILLDPPYWGMKSADYKEGSVSSLSREEFLQFIEKLVQDTYNTLKLNGYVGFLFQDSYRAVKGLYKTEPLFTAELFPFFTNVGFEPVYWITYPLSVHNQYNATQTKLAKELKVLLHILIHFLVFQKK